MLQKLQEVIMKSQSREFLRNIRPPYFDAFYFVDEKDALRTEINAHVFYKLIFFLEGDETYVIRNQQYDLRPGDILVTPRFTSYYRCSVTGGSYKRLVLWFTTELLDAIDDTGELRRFFEEMDKDKNGKRLHFPPSIYDRILDDVYQLVSEQDYDKPMGNVMAFSLMNMVLIGIYRAVASQEEEEDSVASRLVQSIVEHINDHLLDDLSLDRIAETFFISKFYLERIFKKQMSVTVHNYITQRRLTLARQRLYDGAAPTQVYKNCGFSNYATFYRAFQKMYGASPKEFSQQAAAVLSYRDGDRSGNTVFRV